FAIAEFNTFSTTGEAAFGVWRRIAIASPTCLPRIKSATKRTLRGAIRTVLATALACIDNPPLINVLFSYRHLHDLCKYELVRIHQVCDLPYLPLHKLVHVYDHHILR